jgi:hypothetical protein
VRREAVAAGGGLSGLNETGGDYHIKGVLSGEIPAAALPVSKAFAPAIGSSRRATETAGWAAGRRSSGAALPNADANERQGYADAGAINRRRIVR